MLAVHSREGRSFGPIHPADFMFEFLASNPATSERAVDHYVENGQHSAQQLRALLRAHCHVRNPSVLEFAAGYGCATRHLKEHLPAARLTACDIHEMAIDFLRDTLRVEAVLSTDDPERLSLGATFDAVVAVSFFSHLPGETWDAWLKALVRHARPGGIVVFTTHGRKSPAFRTLAPGPDGFAFAAVSEQDDIELARYGTTLTTFDYVFSRIRESGANLVHFHEGLWWGHQDAYVLERPSD